MWCSAATCTGATTGVQRGAQAGPGLRDKTDIALMQALLLLKKLLGDGVRSRCVSARAHCMTERCRIHWSISSKYRIERRTLSCDIFFQHCTFVRSTLCFKYFCLDLLTVDPHSKRDRRHAPLRATSVGATSSRKGGHQSQNKVSSALHYYELVYASYPLFTIPKKKIFILFLCAKRAILHCTCQYTDDYRENEHWITAASPRLLRAMEHALKCPRLKVGLSLVMASATVYG